MALTYDQISAITEKKFIAKLVDNVFDSNPLLKRANTKFKETVDGGTKIICPLNYAEASASDWYQAADTLDTTDNEVITAAEYDWAQCYANIIITGRDEMINSGDSAILKFVKQKVMVAEKTLKSKLGTGLYNAGSTAKAIVGLRAIVDAGSTVGGIAQGTYSWWAAQEDTTSTTLSMSALQSLFNDCAIDNDVPTVAMTTRANYNRYYALLQPQQRFVDQDSASGGFTSLMFNGIPVIVDSYCPANHLFFLNENYLHFYVHKQRDMKFEDFVKPTNQDAKIAKVLWMGALGSSNNRMHGKLEAITA